MYMDYTPNPQPFALPSVGEVNLEAHEADPTKAELVPDAEIVKKVGEIADGMDRGLYNPAYVSHVLLSNLLNNDIVQTVRDRPASTDTAALSEHFGTILAKKWQKEIATNVPMTAKKESSTRSDGDEAPASYLFHIDTSTGCTTLPYEEGDMHQEMYNLLTKIDDDEEEEQFVLQTNPRHDRVEDACTIEVYYDSLLPPPPSKRRRPAGEVEDGMEVDP